MKNCYLVLYSLMLAVTQCSEFRLGISDRGKQLWQEVCRGLPTQIELECQISYLKVKAPTLLNVLTLKTASEYHKKSPKQRVESNFFKWKTLYYIYSTLTCHGYTTLWLPHYNCLCCSSGTCNQCSLSRPIQCCNLECLNAVQGSVSGQQRVKQTA